MAFFAERMKHLTDTLVTDASERAATITELKGETQRVQADARAFLGEVSQAHASMAGELKSRLTADRTELVETVQATLQDLTANRSALRDQLQAQLAEDRAARVQEVETLRQNAREAQQNLANDLKMASKIWKSLSQRTI